MIFSHCPAYRPVGTADIVLLACITYTQCFYNVCVTITCVVISQSFYRTENFKLWGSWTIVISWSWNISFIQVEKRCGTCFIVKFIFKVCHVTQLTINFVSDRKYQRFQGRPPVFLQFSSNHVKWHILSRRSLNLRVRTNLFHSAGLRLPGEQYKEIFSFSCSRVLGHLFLKLSNSTCLPFFATLFMNYKMS